MPLSPVSLSGSVFDAMFAEARACFPDECCGVVLADAFGLQRFVRFDNLQGRLHAADPERHPHSARTAFAFHPLKLQRLVDQTEGDGGSLVAVVHSHPQYPSYFSRTDKASAAPFGAPTFPDAAQLVVSVFDGEVRDVKAFSWDGDDWPERPLEGAPTLPGPPEGARPMEEG